MATKTDAIDGTCEPVNVSAKLRKASPWVEDVAKRAKNAALKKRRQEERNQGVRLRNDQLVELVDELERIQLLLNPLETRREAIVRKLLGHWGHTGVEEIEGTLGQKTLIAPSYELCVDPQVVQSVVSAGIWKAVTLPILQASLLVSAGQEAPQIRKAVSKALRVKKIKVTVTASSSRRPKSGKPDDEEPVT
jgi:hypothetical protein